MGTCETRDLLKKALLEATRRNGTGKAPLTGKEKKLAEEPIPKLALPAVNGQVKSPDKSPASGKLDAKEVNRVQEEVRLDAQRALYEAHVEAREQVEVLREDIAKLNAILVEDRKTIHDYRTQLDADSQLIDDIRRKVDAHKRPTKPIDTSSSRSDFNKRHETNKKEMVNLKDAVGRKFKFPYEFVNTWSGMEELIQKAFIHVDVIGPHVLSGHYDLMGPGGEIILPQVWETFIEPGMAISMSLWPMPEPPTSKRSGPPPPPPGLVGPKIGGEKVPAAGQKGVEPPTQPPNPRPRRAREMSRAMPKAKSAQPTYAVEPSIISSRNSEGEVQRKPWWRSKLKKAMKRPGRIFPARNSIHSDSDSIGSIADD